MTKFSIAFRLRKDLIIDLLKIFNKDLFNKEIERSAAYTVAALSFYCFDILYNSGKLSSRYWRFIWCFCISCIHKVSWAIAKRKNVP